MRGVNDRIFTLKGVIDKKNIAGVEPKLLLTQNYYKNFKYIIINQIQFHDPTYKLRPTGPFLINGS
jgi:hypothetical protein